MSAANTVWNYSKINQFEDQASPARAHLPTLKASQGQRELKTASEKKWNDNSFTLVSFVLLGTSVFHHQSPWENKYTSIKSSEQNSSLLFPVLLTYEDLAFDEAVHFNDISEHPGKA